VPDDDTVRDRQAQPSLAARPSRKEGIEKKGQMLWRDASAVVGHLNEHVLASEMRTDADAPRLGRLLGLDGLRGVDVCRQPAIFTGSASLVLCQHLIFGSESRL
jgi:hypothetical protein